MSETKTTGKDLKDLVRLASGEGSFSDLKERYESYRVSRQAVVNWNEKLRFWAKREYLEDDIRGVAKSEVLQAGEAFEKFRRKNKGFRGFFLSVLKKHAGNVGENISSLEEVYDEVRDMPYDYDAAEIDQWESPGGFLLGYMSDFEDLKYEDPENR